MTDILKNNLFNTVCSIPKTYIKSSEDLVEDLALFYGHMTKML